jgi:ABC-2 type transport system permease protein
MVGLLFTIAFSRHETEESYLNIATYVLLVFGALLTVGSVTAGIFRPDFLAGPGIVLGLLGVGFLGGYFTKEDTSGGIGYSVAFTLGAVGSAVVLYALGRAIFPTVLAEGPNILRNSRQGLDTWRVLGRVISLAIFFGVILLGLTGKKPIWLRATLGLIGLVGAGVFITASFSSPINVTPKPSLVPGGVCLIGLGVVYLAFSLGVCSDNQFVTLTRRELSAYFFSPIGFLVLGGMVLAQWISYLVFIGILTSSPTLPEPIVQVYGHGILNFFIFALLIPILTMRLLAEEKRTGSLEVLLTSPVNETVVVLSKFVGTLIFYMICWLPSGLFLISLRVVGDQPFDYRPMFGYYVGLLGLGAMFISMGLFFSSLTRNQIISAVLTFLVLFVLLFFAILRFNPTIMPLPDSFLVVAERLSYYHMWEESLSGQLPIRDVLLSFTLAVFGLYMTVKVLESRKWS